MSRRLPRSLNTAASLGRSVVRRFCTSIVWARWWGAAATAVMAATAANAAREKAMILWVQLCTVISLRAVARCDGPGFELQLTVFRGETELHLGASCLVADGGHLAPQVGLE